MTRELVYDLIVHPYFGLNSILAYTSIEPSIVTSHYAPVTKKWFAHIVAMKKNPNRGLLIIPSNLSRPEGRKLASALIKFAVRELGGDRCKVTNNVFEIRNLKVNKKKSGLIFGDYYEDCVKDFQYFFTRLTGQRLRRSLSNSVSSRALFNSLSRFSGYYIPRRMVPFKGLKSRRK